jgi:SAM-dependent methyltransferase
MVKRLRRLARTGPRNWFRYAGYKICEEAYYLRTLVRATTRDERLRGMVGPPTLWKMKREFQINFLKSVGLKPDNYLLDIGCGVLRGGIPIIQYLDAGHYYGIDVRPDAIMEAFRLLREAGLESKQPKLLAISHLKEVSFDLSFDFIWAFSSLIHMSDEILDECLECVSRHLKPTGCLYANVHLGEDPDSKWLDFPLIFRPLDFYEEMAERRGLRIEYAGSLRTLGHVSGSPNQDLMAMLKVFKIRRGQGLRDLSVPISGTRYSGSAVG